MAVKNFDAALNIHINAENLMTRMRILFLINVTQFRFVRLYGRKVCCTSVVFNIYLMKCNTGEVWLYK